jgi:hypothetical protein
VNAEAGCCSGPSAVAHPASLLLNFLAASPIMSSASPPSSSSSAAAAAAAGAAGLPPLHRRHRTLTTSYADRSEDEGLAPLATYLLRLIHLKRTNLCVSADVSTTAELLQVAEEVGDHICVLKTHADIINDFSDRTIRGLIDVSRRKKFVIFEDRKFGDIGSESFN